jgi:competence protein ComEA
MQIHKDAKGKNQMTDENHNGSNVKTITIFGRLLLEKLSEGGLKIERRQAIAILIVLLTVAAGLIVSNINSQSHPINEFPAGGKEEISVDSANSFDNSQTMSGGGKKTATDKKTDSITQATKFIMVHVAGAVACPGIYKLKEGDRINDAIVAAGGGTQISDINSLNLAEKVIDGQKIYVPKRGEIPSSAVQSSLISGSKGSISGTGSNQGLPVIAGSNVPSGYSGGIVNQLDGCKVDLNTASLAQLDALPGVGGVTAQRIIDYRTQHGSFKSINELQEVDGIGPKKFDQLKSHVTTN